MSYIGLDIGTSSVKGILIADNTEVLDTKELQYPIEINELGHSQQNPEDWYCKTIMVLQCLIKSSNEKIKGISFSGQMHSMVPLDENGDVVRPAILWNDQRTQDECDYLNNEFSWQRLIANTGNIALTGFTAPKILWYQKHEPDNFAKTKMYLMPKDYIVYRLTGVYATDVSDASGTLYYDVKNKKWSKQMLEILNITEENVPNVYESNTIVGRTSEQINQTLGLSEAITVIIGGADQAISAIGVGITKANQVSIALGTSGVVFASSKKFNPNLAGKLHSFCDATGNYYTMGVALTSGASVKWWYEEILQKTQYLTIEQELNQAVEQSPFFLPYLNGERTPLNDSQIRGAFLNISLNNKQADLTKAVIEGISFSMYHIFQTMELTDVLEIKVAGGGAKNAFWMQQLANIFNMKISVKKELNGGPSFGAALLAKSAYEAKDLATITAEITEAITEYLPVADQHEFYQLRFKEWMTYYPKIKN